MPRKLYIHVGPTKTGTSAVQSTLSKHDGSLLLYPRTGRHHPHGSHHHFVSALIKGRGDADTLLGALATEARASERNLLISSEWIIRKKRGAIELIHRILESLGPESWDVEILFGCREHFERAASAYSQCIKNGETRDPDQFLRERLGSLLYSQMTRTLLTAGFKLTALNYHPSSGWLGRFLQHIGFPESEMPEPEIKNSSLSTKALIGQLAMSRTVDDPEQHVIFRKALKETGGYYARSKGFIFGSRVVAEVGQEFESDRAFLANKFGIKLPEPSIPGNTGFFLGAEDLADIHTAASQLGSVGAKIVDCAAAFAAQDQAA